MKFRKLTAGAVLVVAAMGLGAGTSYAAPSSSPSDITYDAKLVGQDIVTHVTGGSFAISPDGQAWQFRDPDGHLHLQVPLSYTNNATALKYPVRAQISSDAKTLTLTPSKNPLEATLNLERHPVASDNENLQAYAHFSSILGIAMAVGGLVGMAIGAVVGCLVPGLFTGGVLCLPGLAVGAGVGSVIGTIAAGGPTLIAAGIDLVQTLQAPPGTTRYAHP